MFDFQQKRRIRTIFTSRITWVVLLVIASFIIVSAYDRYLIARDMADRRLEVETEIRALELRKDNLEAEVQYLSNERGIEAQMRRQFDIAREGEQVVIILDDTFAASSSEQVETVVVPRPWYRFW